MPKFSANRAHLETLHRRGETAATFLDAVTRIVGGGVMFVGGLRALLDTVSPLPTKPPTND